ncbi:MAG TPA: DUF4304 domain-containing protein, partial [Candidatus Kapabacteria bacterium]|nr:DUF4304 domain-containing protein [Candidatus Kapabacteria bacterium]
MKAPQQTSPRTKRSSELISAPRKATTIEIDEEVLLRNGMEAALQQHIIPWLLENGFTGQMPHFQRRRAHHLELLTFQFDRYGGGFVIELGKAPLGDFTVSNGEVIPESLLTPS